MKHESARVGIVVPTLGTRAEWLAEAIASIERQGEGVEVVIVAPPEVLPLIRSQFPGRRAVGEAEKGIVPAIEAGWRELKECQILAWLGDDDQLTPGSVRAAVSSLANDCGAAMVYGDFEYMDRAGKHLVTVRPGRWATLWLVLGQNFIGQPGCLYMREAVARTGGLSHSLRLAFDVELHMNLARERAVYCPVTLARVRRHASSLTMADRDASMAELQAAVWGYRPRSYRTRLLRHGRPMWKFCGRLYFRFRRTY